MGSLPLGLISPKSSSQIACAPCSPGYHASSTAPQPSSQPLISTGEPLRSTTAELGLAAVILRMLSSWSVLTSNSILPTITALSSSCALRVTPGRRISERSRPSPSTMAVIYTAASHSAAICSMHSSGAKTTSAKPSRYSRRY